MGGNRTSLPHWQTGAVTVQTSPFQAVVFDVDGTLTDSEVLWDVVRRELAADDGIDYPDSATVAMMGMSTAEWSTYMADDMGYRGTPTEVAGRVIERMRQHYLDGRVPVMRGAREAVRAMASVGPVGVASSSPIVLIEAAMAELGITGVVQAHVSTEQVERGKPAPDGYLRCAEILGVDPTRCLAVEDSANGIRSALAAGMAVVCVPPAFHPPSDDLLARCTVLESLDELTPERLTTI